jgi:5-dehydro-2-deoxygluconokinase
VAALVTKAASRTQIAFVEVWPPDRFPVTFYRPAPAPDTLLTLADLPAPLLEAAPVVVVSGALLATEPARSTALTILEDRRASRDRRRASWTLLDLDWRPTLWNDRAEAPALVERAIRLSDILVGSDEEFAAAARPPDLDPDGGPAMIVLKHGPDGVSLVTETGRRSLPGIAVDVLCGTGAGDALTAAFAAGLLRGLDPLVALERGNVAGAIVATRLMCSTAMPTADEIDALLARSPAASQGAVP